MWQRHGTIQGFHLLYYVLQIGRTAEWQRHLKFRNQLSPPFNMQHGGQCILVSSFLCCCPLVLPQWPPTSVDEGSSNVSGTQNPHQTFVQTWHNLPQMPFCIFKPGSASWIGPLNFELELGTNHCIGGLVWFASWLKNWFVGWLPHPTVAHSATTPWPASYRHSCWTGTHWRGWGTKLQVNYTARN